MIDLVTTQEDLTWVLLSSEQLSFAQVKSFRSMRISQELDWRTLLTTPRNGKVGVGVVVLMPIALAKHVNVDGPVLDWDFPIVITENDQVNHTALIGNDEQGNPIAGSFVTAEQTGQIVMDILHKEADERIGTYAVTGKPMEQEKEYTFPGCIGYRITLTVSGAKVAQSRRVSPVLYVRDANGYVTMSCATVGATIRYTLDGSLPAAESAGNVAAQTYNQPVFVAAGAVLRATAYKTGLNKSTTRYLVAT